MLTSIVSCLIIFLGCHLGRSLVCDLYHYLQCIPDRNFDHYLDDLDHYLGGNLEYMLDSGLTFDLSHTLESCAIKKVII